MSVPAVLNQTATALDPTAAVPESQVTGLAADLAAKVPRFLRSGLYHRTIPTPSLTTSATLGVGSLRLAPFDVPRSVTLTRIGAEITSGGDSGSKYRLGIYADDGTGYPGALVLDTGAVPFSDGVTTNTSTTFTSATANFTAADVGRSITGAGIQAATTIGSVTNTTTVVLSAAATATASGVSFTLDRAVNANSATVQETTISPTLAAGRYWVGGVVQGVTVTQPTVRTVNAAMLDTGSPSLFTAGQTTYGYNQASVTGALPPNFTTTVSPSGAVASVFVKVA